MTITALLSSKPSWKCTNCMKMLPFEIIVDKITQNIDKTNPMQAKFFYETNQRQKCADKNFVDILDQE